MMARFGWLRRISTTAGLLCAASGGFAADPANIPAENQIELPGISRWQPLSTFSTGFGYKDNVMLSDANPIGSAFVKNTLEFLLWRLPDGNTDFQGFVSGDDIRYLRSPALGTGPSLRKEEAAIAQAELKHTFGERWRIGLTAEYSYLDQVVDSTILIGSPNSVKARSQAFTARSPIRYELGNGYWAGLEADASRVQYFSPTDQSYWETGPKATIGREYGNQSTIAASYQLNLRQYSDQPEVDALGNELAGTRLSLLQNRAELEWRHHFDSERNWRLTSKFLFERNHSYGSDFFGYRRYRLTEQLRYRKDGWELTAETSAGLYDYDLQTADLTGTALRSSQQLNIGIRVERKLTSHLRAYASYDFDRILSNLTTEEYNATTVVAGVLVEF